MGDYQKGFQVIQELVGKRWVPEIIRALAQGATTYTDILNSIDYLSHTELQRKLKVLEEYNAVDRVVGEKENIHYKLNTLGYELDHIFNHFYDLGTKYFSENAQSHYSVMR